MKRIEFKIKDGEVSIEVFGVEDASCEDMTRIFQEELGAVVERHEKPQTYQELDSINLFETE